MKDSKYKSTTELVQYLIDNVSKNGFMLLNIGPKPNGIIPDEDKSILEGIGKWLDVNGEAIFDTCLLYTSPSPRDKRQSRMPSSA